MVKNTGRKLLSVNALSIYGNPDDEVQYEVVEKPYNFLERSVASLRISLSHTSESVEVSTNQIKTVYDTGVSHITSTYDYLTNEANSVTRAATITFGGLCGLLIGARGGLFKKVIYTGTGLIATASLCYPKEAVEISKKSYDYVRTQGFSTVKEISGYDLNEVFKPIEGKMKEIELPSTLKNFFSQEKPQYEGDLGQSNPKDKDMYTTRNT